MSFLLSRCGRRRCNWLEARGQEAVRSLLPALSLFIGLGGIFVEVLKDVSSGLAPLSYEEAYSMIHSLRAYKIIQGTRGQKGVNEDKFAEIIVRLSTLLRFATEIKEMDINPLLATEKAVVAVDARIKIEK